MCRLRGCKQNKIALFRPALGTAVVAPCAMQKHFITEPVTTSSKLNDEGDRERERKLFALPFSLMSHCSGGAAAFCSEVSIEKGKGKLITRFDGT